MIVNARRDGGHISRANPFGEEAHAVVKHEYAGRCWRTPAEVDQHDVAVVECRHHAVALDMHDAQVGWVGSQILLYPGSLEMIRASVHGLVLDQMATAHGGPDCDRRDGDKTIVGVLDDRRFALYLPCHG